MLSCEIIFKCQTFNFVGTAIHEFEDSNKIEIHLRNIAYYLKSTNSSVHEHFHHRLTTKFCAQEIKLFHSNLCLFIYLIECCILALIRLNKLFDCGQSTNRRSWDNQYQPPNSESNWLLPHMSQLWGTTDCFLTWASCEG